AAARAAQGERAQRALGAACAAESRRRDDVDLELGALHRRVLRDQLEGELERGWHHLPEMANLHLHLRDAPPRRVSVGDPHDRFRYRQLVHQQILGSGSPTSMSITRRPPKPVSTSTIPGGSLLTSPTSAACSHPGTERSAESAASAASAATNATSTPSLATYS